MNRELTIIQTAITGHFQYQPPADGVYITDLVPPKDFPNCVQFIVSQGAIPAILLLDPGGHDITLIGLKGEDEVRIGKTGTWANTARDTWRHWSQTHRATLEAGAWPVDTSLARRQLFLT